jgi:hypothetical protein
LIFHFTNKTTISLRHLHHRELKSSQRMGNTRVVAFLAPAFLLTSSSQALADQSHLTTFGLPTRRDPGGIAAGPSAHLRVRFHAGWQTLSRAFWLSEAPECIDVFESVSAVAAASGAAATPSRWVECYDQSFDSISGGARWLWDYQAGYLGDPDDEPSDAAESR